MRLIVIHSTPGPFELSIFRGFLIPSPAQRAAAICVYLNIVHILRADLSYDVT
jgi:hypothetical protein